MKNMFDKFGEQINGFDIDKDIIIRLEKFFKENFKKGYTLPDLCYLTHKNINVIMYKIMVEGSLNGENK